MKPLECYFGDIYNYLDDYQQVYSSMVSNFTVNDDEDIEDHKEMMSNLENINSFISRIEDSIENRSSLRIGVNDLNVISKLLFFKKTNLETHIQIDDLKPKALSKMKKELIKISEIEKSFNEFVESCDFCTVE